MPKRLIKQALFVQPTDSKESNFNFALADYLCKELNHAGIEAKRNNVIVTVNLLNMVKDKYEKVVIDCLDGKIYLRGNEVSDNYFGRLRNFEGSRASDAYQCLVQSATRLINRINQLNDDIFDDDGEIEVMGNDEVKNDYISQYRVKLANINDDAEAWVDERVKEIMDTDESGMPMGQAYGMAWGEWKEEHPEWKPRNANLKNNGYIRVINGSAYLYKSKPRLGDDTYAVGRVVDDTIELEFKPEIVSIDNLNRVAYLLNELYPGKVWIAVRNTGKNKNSQLIK